MPVFKIVVAVLTSLGSFAIGLFMPQKVIDGYFMQRDGKIGFKIYLLRFVLVLVLATLVAFFVYL